MPSIEFSVDMGTGAASMRIKGLRGKTACQPIHDALSASLLKELGIGEVSAELTDEGKDKPLTVTKPLSVQARR